MTSLIYFRALAGQSHSDLQAVADPAMGGQGGRPPPIGQKLGLVMAARLRHGGKFSLKSLIFGHFFA